MRSFHEALQAAGLPAPPLGPQENEIDVRWRALTEAGNQAFAHGDDAEAWRLYESALLAAEQMFEMALEGGTALLAPMVYNIACANAAETKMRIGDRNAAFSFLFRAFEKLVAIAASATSPMGLRVNCVRHLSYTFERLGSEFAGDMERRDVQHLLKRAGDAANEVGRIAEWLMQRRQSGGPAEAEPASTKAN